MQKALQNMAVKRGEFTDLLKEFANLNLERFGSRDYNSGFFESMCTSLYMDMPKKHQEFHLNRMKQMVESIKEKENV
jgi:hypothetical protein